MNFYIILGFCILTIAVPSLGQCTKDKSCDTPSCCSEWGFCGFGPDFCGSTCIRDCDIRPECGQYSLTTECPLKVCCSEFGFCGTTADFCSPTCQSNCNAPVMKTCDANSALIRVGYYESWALDRSCYPYSADNINPRSYTHLNYAFGTISDGVMIPPSGVDLTEIQAFVGLKLINTNLKTLISVGGWAFTDPGPTQQEFHNIISTSASRAKFINSVQIYLDSYGLDGIDIDYEYPSASDRGGYPEDKMNFVQLVKEMRSAFGSNYLITIAAPASYWYLQNFAIGEMSQYVDFINVMTYDIHGTWDADIASLGPFVRSHTNIKETELALELFLRDGVPSQKLVLGLAYYGRSFQLASPSCTQIGCEFIGPARAGPCTNSPGTLAWFEINDIIATTGSQPTFDSDSMSKILVFNTDQWVAYDDEETLLLRTNYAGENCLLGTMIWSIDQGIEQTSGSTSLMRSGFLNINNVNLQVYFVYTVFGFVARYNITSDYSYVGDELTGNFVTISTLDTATPTCDSAVGTFDSISASMSTCTATPTQTLNTAPTPIPTIFWDTIVDVLLNDPGIQEAAIDGDNSDPTIMVLIRPLSGGFRVEYVEALIFPTHLGQQRTNFNDADSTYMVAVLDAITGDERGHLVADSLGGRPIRTNLTPQSSYINRNAGGRNIITSWFTAEAEARNWLKDERSDGRLTSYVRWRVALHYDNDTIGRATYFSLVSTMFRNGVQVDYTGTLNYRMCNGGPDAGACPPKKDMK